MNDDFLDDVLMPPIRESSAAARDSLRERTAGVVRWRRYRRRAWQVVGALAAQGVVAAAVVAWLLATGTISWRHQTLPENPVAKGVELPPEAPTPIPENPLPVSAVDLEWRAFDAPAEQQPALYFEAGQRYFDEQNDLESALRCYRQAFDSRPQELLTVSPTDNWLAMAIKIDCRKEN